MLDGEEPTEGLTDGGTSLDGRRLVLVTVPEPEYEVIKEQTQTMKCVATADKPSYACETTSLQFNAIPMYQSLRATFQVQNTSTIPLPYKMLLTNDGSPMTAASQRRPQTGGAVYGHNCFIIGSGSLANCVRYHNCSTHHCRRATA